MSGSCECCERRLRWQTSGVEGKLHCKVAFLSTCRAGTVVFGVVLWKLSRAHAYRVVPRCNVVSAPDCNMTQSDHDHFLHIHTNCYYIMRL